MELDDQVFFTQFVKCDSKKPRGYAFTWNNYTEEDIEQLKSLKCRYITFSQEVGKSGTPHLQGFIYFENGRHVGGVRQLFGAWHVEPVKGAPSENIIYIGKDAERYERGDRPKDTETKAALESQLWERMYEAAKEGRMDDIPRIHYVRYKRTFDQIRDENRPVKRLSLWGAGGPGQLSLGAEGPEPRGAEGPEFYPWQAELLAILSQSPDPRKIIWYFDPAGGKGKSEMASYLREQGACVLPMAKYDTMAYLVPDEGNRVFVFNISRGAMGTIDYRFLENLKDGVIYSEKYVPVEKRFARPHVVVFSNSLPDVTKMSGDRFQIITL